MRACPAIYVDNTAVYESRSGLKPVILGCWGDRRAVGGDPTAVHAHPVGCIGRAALAEALAAAGAMSPQAAGRERAAVRLRAAEDAAPAQLLCNQERLHHSALWHAHPV